MTSPAGEALGPVTTGERIHEIDVVRGFALLGIFLMNVEFFSRALAGIGEGMPRGLTGIDWFASWFIAYFVQGKFWTIFTLLFGMGFAVMLARAERAERTFMVPYLRRILALAVFGAIHFIAIWQGDILFSYAVAAGGLLILLYGTWRPIVVALVVLIGLAFVPGLRGAGAVAGSLALISLTAIHLRSEKRLNLRFARVPVFSFIFWILGVIGAIVAIALWVVPEAPAAPRIPVTAISSVLLLLAFLSGRYRDPVELRSLRVGVTVYVLPALFLIIIGTARYLSPPEPDLPVAKPVATAKAGPPTAAPTEEQAERAKRLAEQQEQIRKEVRILSEGTYPEAVEMRARAFPGRLVEDSAFALVSIGMFLIGVWFVRSGVMENAGAHLRLFRRLAYIGLPLGIGLGLLGGLIATSHTPGVSNDGFQVARGLAMIGSLPASLGYVGLVVLALHSQRAFAKVRVLAPLGRMALTNYLLQSLISSLVFYGYAGGQWGMARSWQVVFVFVVFALQVAFSHWWLARFRYGPMEWLWRAFTYRQKPAMRLAAAPPPG